MASMPSRAGLERTRAPRQSQARLPFPVSLIARRFSLARFTGEADMSNLERRGGR
eukprot:CAMPEP_0171209836 /NCGR_PEP_ID=MMETSP0790-20130122/28797_1 /TAXON_ID=2925 /ORGANISM="Alexandrium catenella, Strain OF101" /LENGTH=54 /DNA_ID=CAMNT_0011675451 /DNA_START=20 /DNA_END=181 /DNA_ORIENTATION=+